MKISRTNRDSVFPESLFDADVPAEIFFRPQPKIHPKNFVLTARRTESGRHARMQRCVRLLDLVTASESISPNVSELIEIIETPPRDEDEIVDVNGGLQEAGHLLGVIADKRRLWTKRLRYKRPLLASVNAAVKESRCQREPRSRLQIVLIIDSRSLEERTRRSDKSILIRVVQLPFMIVTENEFVLPPIADMKIDMGRDEPFFG